MKISVTVITRAKENLVEPVGSTTFRVKTTQAPEKGKANEKVIELLAQHFQIRKSQIMLSKGETSHRKTFEIKL